MLYRWRNQSVFEPKTEQVPLLPKGTAKYKCKKQRKVLEKHDLIRLD